MLLEKGMAIHSSILAWRIPFSLLLLEWEGRRDPQLVNHSFDGLCLTRSYTPRVGRVSLGKVMWPTHFYFCFKD